MKTLKLYTSDGRALTDLQSADDSISLPTEIKVGRSGRAHACHADRGDFFYPSLSALCEAYQLDRAAVIAQEWREHHARD